MKAKPPAPSEFDLFRSELKSILNLNHELCQLAELVDWSIFDQRFAEYFP
ncbi:MAG: hypothetical protein K0Q74_1569, partial [Gammaproteobacteria bacterium]|nr:hypothetical protein [Gammaproteobacteria bacterium]